MRLWVLGAALATSCNSIAGLGDLRFESTPVGGAGGSGGSGGDAGGVGGEAGAGASAGSAPCGSVGALVDEFDDRVTSDSWLIAGSANGVVEETGGDAVFTVAASSDECFGYTSVFRYALPESEVQVGLPVPIEPGVNASLLVGNGTTFLEIVHRPDGTLRSVYNSGVLMDLSSTPYEPAAHRYWRIREADDEVHWETSPDGDRWTEQASLASTNLPLDYLNVSITACGSSGAPASSVHFDRLAGGPEATNCPAHTLTDDFEDNVVDAKWGRFLTQSGGLGSETSGQLVVTLPDGAGGALYQHTSARAFDMRGSHAVVELPSLLIGAEGQVWFEVDRYNPATGSERYVGFNIETGQLKCEYNVGSGTVELAAIPLSVSDHRWLRLREDAGTFYWETSPNGMDWTVVTGAPSPMHMDQVDVEIGAQRQLSSPAVSAHWDNVNLPP